MEFNRDGWTLLSAVAFVLATAGLSSAADTLVVEQDGGAYTTIQSAIDAAVAGDEVLVRCGTYMEVVALKDGVHLRGEDPRCVIVDGEFSGDVVTIPSVLQPTVVEGLTIRHGNQTAGTRGAGVLVIGPGSPIITRNIIEDNGIAGTGTGIAVSGTFTVSDSPVISNNIIRGNVNCCIGGGISLDGSTGARIVGNLIAGNSAYYGGAIYAYYGATIENNTILDNDAWVGGGIVSFGGSLGIVNNLIEGNTAVIYGGGVFINDISNVKNNNVVGNSQDNWDTPAGDLTGVDGNISQPSQLVDRNRWTFDGVQPRSTSPLVDAGSAVVGPLLDLRGVERPLDGDADGNASIDIGARENEGVSGVRFGANDVLTWDASGESFDLYRGDLATLRATGIYTQDPAVVLQSAVVCVLARPGEPQLVDPFVGETFFYLIAVRGAQLEGPLGVNSDRTLRLLTLPDCID